MTFRPSVYPRGISVGGSKFNQRMMRRKRTCGVGQARISGEQKSLAAATSEVFGAAVATAARLGHPLFAAEALEGGGLVPNPFEGMIAHVVESHARNDAGGVAR